MKRIVKALLYPNGVLLAVLSVCAVAFLVYTFVHKAPDELMSILSYVLSAYTLTAFCFRIPQIIRSFKSFKENNKYLRRWLTDTHLRTIALLSASLLANIIYSVFQLSLGFASRSVWFCLLAGYYVLLAFIRLFLLHYVNNHRLGEDIITELKKCRLCGVVFLAVNLVLSGVIFFMVYRNNTFFHGEIVTIAIASYTFTSLTVSIINIVKHRGFNPPVGFALKAISLAAASVSLLILEATMLTTFDDGAVTLQVRQLMLGVSGAAVSALVICMAIYMIFGANQRIKILSADCTQTD